MIDSWYIPYIAMFTVGYILGEKGTTIAPLDGFMAAILALGALAILSRKWQRTADKIDGRLS